MPQRFPAANYKPNRRCKGLLRVGAPFTNTAILYEILPIAGASAWRARIKTATAGGTLDAFYIGPDVEIEAAIANATAYASIGGTIYTSGNPSQVAVTAATETKIEDSPKGEGYVLLKFTGGGTGTISFVDLVTLNT